MQAVELRFQIQFAQSDNNAFTPKLVHVHGALERGDKENHPHAQIAGRWSTRRTNIHFKDLLRFDISKCLLMEDPNVSHYLSFTLRKAQTQCFNLGYTGMLILCSHIHVSCVDSLICFLLIGKQEKQLDKNPDYMDFFVGRTPDGDAFTATSEYWRQCGQVWMLLLLCNYVCIPLLVCDSWLCRNMISRVKILPTSMLITKLVHISRAIEQERNCYSSQKQICKVSVIHMLSVLNCNP